MADGDIADFNQGQTIGQVTPGQQAAGGQFQPSIEDRAHQMLKQGLISQEQYNQLMATVQQSYAGPPERQRMNGVTPERQPMEGITPERPRLPDETLQRRRLGE